MPEFNLDQLLKIYQLSSELYLRIQEQRATARALAATAGVSDADLDAADARFARRYFENPDTPPAELPIPSGHPSDVVYPDLSAAIVALPDGWVVIQMEDGTFRVWPVIGPYPGVRVYP